MALEKSGSPLEPFLLLGKNVHGAAAVELIKQVIEAPGVYAFGEILDMPNIKELADTPNGSYIRLLELFAYGKYSDFKAHREVLPECSPLMLRKLQHLTIVSLASIKKCLPYSELLAELDLKNVRQLEDLVIEIIYANVIEGKLDQKKQMLEVEHTIGRDLKKEDVHRVTTVLQNWCTSCESVLKVVEEQITKANEAKAKFTSEKQKTEEQILAIKKTIKQSFDIEEHMVTDSNFERPSKKASKAKGIRTGGKFFK